MGASRKKPPDVVLDECIEYSERVADRSGFKRVRIGYLVGFEDSIRVAWGLTSRVSIFNPLRIIEVRIAVSALQ